MTKRRTAQDDMHGRLEQVEHARRDAIEVPDQWNAPDEVELLPVSRQRRMELVGRRVDEWAEVAGWRPFSIHEIADVDVSEAVPARPQRREQERTSVDSDLRVELPRVLQSAARHG